MKFPIYGNIKAMFQTTNQIYKGINKKAMMILMAGHVAILPHG